ncbi:c-type cytochrome [Variovorax sp. RHLX14]|uniref:c-type cytochrome n=1 Tax=Variovorax sp. RHLX14 TaxID=1259731 RepID=UPI003F47560F
MGVASTTRGTSISRNARSSRAAAVRPSLQITNGQFVFRNGCTACHSIGGGDKIGPDLLGITERQQRSWLEKFVLVPDEMLAAGDPVANELLKKYKGVRMPNLGLSREEVADILAHVETRTAEVRDRQVRAGIPTKAPDKSELETTTSSPTRDARK